MKRKSAKELLADSFRELAAETSINKITIRDITDNCGYSTATFYRQFKDKYDLIAWDYARQVDEIMSQIGTGDHAWEQTLLDAAHYFHDQKEYLENLLLHTNGMDSFIAYMREINYNSLKRTVLSVSGLPSLDEKTQMYIRIYVLGTVQLTCEWILGGYDAGPEVLAEIYDRALPEPLRPFVSKMR